MTDLKPSLFLYKSSTAKAMWLFCYLLIFVASFSVSGRGLPSLSLDPSWQAVLEYSFLNHFQFGKDIVFTYGPLGFLNTSVSQGHLIGLRIVFAVLWSFMVAWATTRTACEIPGWLKYPFLLWFIAFSCQGSLESHAVLVMAFCCKNILAENSDNLIVVLLSLLVLAVLSLIKFTFCFGALVSIVVCAAIKMRSRDIKSAAIIVCGFAALVIAIWVASDQRIANIFSYISTGIEISSGYSEAMAWPAKAWVLPVCLFAGVIFLSTAFWMILSWKNSVTFGLISIVVLYAFIIWKHGMVRADDHVFSYILQLPLLFGVLLSLIPLRDYASSAKVRFGFSALFLAVVALCSTAGTLHSSSFWHRLPSSPRHIANNAALLGDICLGNYADVFGALKPSNLANRNPTLPLAKQIIGSRSVDVINYRQWAVLANGLNYDPRPVIQGYSAYTPVLQELNRAHFAGSSRPRFVLFNMETIDSRFPTLDDAPLIAEILTGYRIAAREGGFLILQDTGSHDVLHKRLVQDGTVSFDEVIDLRKWNSSPLFVQVFVPQTIVGRFLNMVYIPPIAGISVRSGMKISSFRLPTAMASSGFLLSPILYNNAAVEAFMAHRDGIRADSVKFIRLGGPTALLPDKIQFKIFVLEI